MVMVKMVQVVARPLRTQQPATALLRLLSPLFPIKTSSNHLHQRQQHHHLSVAARRPPRSDDRDVDFRVHGLRLSQQPLQSDLEGDYYSDSELSEKRSRNEKKREARRGFSWALQIAKFSVPQIKLILRAASLDQEVFDAIMLVKKLGPDVREGKRRQYNYIGRLLRHLEPELMDGLLQATKDGDTSKVQALADTATTLNEGDNEGDVDESNYEEEEEDEEDTEVCQNYVNVATRWFEGLIDKNSDVTNEVYSLYSVEYDRQELRKLVRRVHTIKEQQLTNENEGAGDANLVGAEKSLIRFLRSVAKQMPTE